MKTNQAHRIVGKLMIIVGVSSQQVMAGGIEERHECTMVYHVTKFLFPRPAVPRRMNLTNPFQDITVARE